MAFRSGGRTNWALTQFAVEPPDPQFHCANGYENASMSNQITLETTTRLIGCTKSPNKHLTLVVDTNEGGGTSIQLDSIDEQIKKLRDDLTSQMLQTKKDGDKRVDDLISSTNDAIRRDMNRAIQDNKLWEKFFRKEGNDGSVSCDTYCRGAEWPPEVGLCVGARIPSREQLYSCSETASTAGTLRVTCYCVTTKFPAQ
jgi:hypothetical protein